MAKGDSKRAQKMIDAQGQQQQARMNLLFNQNYNQYQTPVQGAQGTGPGQFGTGPQAGQAGARPNPNAPNTGSQGADTSWYNPQDPQGSVMRLLEGKPPTSQTILSLKPQFDAVGIEISPPNAEGITSKIHIPGIGWTRVLDQGVADPTVGGKGTGWVYIPQGTTGPGGKQSIGGGDFSGAGYGQGLLSPALGGYRNFIETGGFSPQDIQNIRARSIAPIRAMYGQGMDELSRMKNVQGGYMPNYGPAMAKMQREMSYRIGDQSLNTEAELAQQIRQGRMGGLQGFSQLGSTINQQGLQGQQLANQFGLGLIGAQIDKSRIPNAYQQALSNVSGTANVVGQIGAGLSGL